MTNTQTTSACSEARTDANRRNAQHSTGPRTEAGKARSSQNAVRAGWFARDLRVAEGKEQLYLEFEQAWRDEIQPEGVFEHEAFTDYLRALWQKREVIEARNEFRAAASSAFLEDEAAPKLDRLHRYERDFERRATRALRELRRLQTERASRAQLSSSEKTNPSAAADTGAAPPPLADASSLVRKRIQVPLDLPEDLHQYLHVLEIETNHWNARYRANKAGLMTDTHAA